MFFRTLSTRLFIGSFLLFLFVWYMMAGSDVFSFNLFSAWTYKQGNIKIGENYVSEGAVDDTIVGLVIANMTFGEGEYAHTSEQLIQKALKLFDMSQALVQVDILQLVTNSTNPEEVLDAHIDHTNHTLTSMTTMVDEVADMAQLYLEKSAHCLLEKREGDELFFAGVHSNDAPDTAEGLTISLNAAPCYITNRIKANAYAYMVEKVSTYQRILQRRHDLLVQHGDVIIHNTAYLEGNTLEELIALRDEMRRVNTVQYEDIEPLFNFNVWNNDWDTGALPQFDKVFFDKGDIPRFGKPINNPLVW